MKYSTQSVYPTNAKLSKERLPQDWYDRFGESLTERLVDQTLGHYLWLHQRSCEHFSQFEDVPWDQRNLDDLLSGKKLYLPVAWCVANKLAVAYHVSPYPATFPHLTPREIGQMFGRRNLAEEAFSHWTQHCDPTGRQDGRSVLGLIDLSASDNERLCRWIGLGGPSTGGEYAAQQAKDLRKLVQKHAQLCDLVQARIYQTAQSNYHDECPSGFNGLHYIDGEAKYYHSALLPIARAVFMVAWSDMPKHGTVLLVLTGDNGELRSGPITFDSLEASEIIAYRGDGVVELHLETAVRFLIRLNALEEQANEDLRRIHAARKDRLEQHMRDGAKQKIEEFRVSHLTLDGATIGPGCADIRLAWQEIVAEQSENSKL